MKKEYTERDLWSSNDEEIVDLLNKYSRIVEQNDKTIEELRDFIFWLLDHVRL